MPPARQRLRRPCRVLRSVVNRWLTSSQTSRENGMKVSRSLIIGVPRSSALPWSSTAPVAASPPHRVSAGVTGTAASGRRRAATAKARARLIPTAVTRDTSCP